MPKPTIAVVGMACRFPGASDLAQFWENIENERNFSGDVPPERWIADKADMLAAGWQPDRAYSQKACLIRDFRFDPGEFNLDRQLLSALDPLHRITLSVGRQAFESCRTEEISRLQTGVILAAIALPTDGSSAISRRLFFSALEKHLFAAGEKEKAAPISKIEALASKVVSLPATLLAMELGLGGNAYTLDAACASSSYALKLACDELISGRADMMLTGGVSRPECLYTQVGFSQLKALSPSGRCAPFDEKADGLVVGEGAGILVLKRLEDALSHGDKIYGLIRGIGLSNDMRGNLLAPDTEGQVRAMRAAYAAAGWSPADVEYIECHGTGTPTGDMVELQSLCELWSGVDRQEGRCAIGSVKSMIGHLLTAAAAAGLIKTLLAMQNNLLPPSLNFIRPPANSPLNKSPFKVQTHAEPWPDRRSRDSKRAAISAFGFGGINAHLLIESFEPDRDQPRRSAHNVPVSLPVDNRTRENVVAVVGMQTMAGSLTSLKEFQEVVFTAGTAIAPRSDGRWKGVDDAAGRFLGQEDLPGAYLDTLDLQVGEFQIPPNEIEQILPQQLLMLKTAAGALLDAQMPLRENRIRMGAVIGINFDPEATNFHLRWALDRELTQLRQKHNFSFPEDKSEELKSALGPALNAPRTLGALGGIVASRIAREFRLGGPSFVVSAEEASGLKALEIGVRSLGSGELDAVLVGAVDLCGDARSVLTQNSLASFSKSAGVAPFDSKADGGLPGEGAVALVLKRLDDALEAEDRIYAVIRGMGSAAPETPSFAACTPAVYARSLERAFDDARLSKEKIDYVETHGSANPAEDETELTALRSSFQDGRSKEDPMLLGSLRPVIGHTGAAAGLFSVAKACLALFHRIVPPLLNYADPSHDALREENFHLPRFAHYWARNQCDGPRRAVVAAMTNDGACGHVILEELDAPLKSTAALKVAQARKRPLGMTPHALFTLHGDTPKDLQNNLNALERYLLNSRQAPFSSLESLARAWMMQQGNEKSKNGRRLAIVAKDKDHLMRWIDQARILVQNNASARISGPGGIAYSSSPLARDGRVAFVYPGSGNHYLGMGRGIGLHWPEVLRQMDLATEKLKEQMLPHAYVPTRAAWPYDWEKKSNAGIVASALTMIFGQVVHGGVTTHLIEKFGISPQAVIGYSLGQTSGYFATRAWPERGEMLGRMLGNPLFKTELTGPCLAARKIWGIGETEEFEWKVAVLNRSEEDVRQAIAPYPLVRLLIVNTPFECVIGGHGPMVRSAIGDLGCEAIYLEGVVTVHCEAVAPVAQAYHDLHLFPTHPPEGVRYYSCAAGEAHDLTRESAAEAISAQAMKGFDFTQTIRSAYSDGVRLFVEMGPHSSCSRMIRTTLGDLPHLAESICQRGEDDYFTVIKLLGNLLAQGVNVDLESLYGDAAYPAHVSASPPSLTGAKVNVAIGGHCIGEALAAAAGRFAGNDRENVAPMDVSPADPAKMFEIPEQADVVDIVALEPKRTETAPPQPAIEIAPKTVDESILMNDSPTSALIRTLTETNAAIAGSHDRFLDFSMQLQQAMGEALRFQSTLLSQTGQAGMAAEAFGAEEFPINKTAAASSQRSTAAAYSREMCLEFAIGSAARVLGPEFAALDTYPARVRLPDEPLMLVDRILSVDGEKGSLTSGRVITEHDVLPGAWYLDGDRAPVCISVEAGQADLFLCAYLGIDLKVKGLRTYRLLDAKVTFHRGLPRPGDTIRYEIRIDKFIRQQETYLFFFSFEGYIGNEHLITMTDGCAGFFTPEEVCNSGGIILTPAETVRVAGKRPPDWRPLAPMAVESYSDQQIQALRLGDLAACFGPAFNNKRVAESLRLPSGRMHLIHRVVALEPEGGRFGLGRIVAEADIHPDDWFLTCHFVDDMVMPGTLMYECCAHALRIFLQRMGWITENPEACYEPKVGLPARLKCRGPVTPATAKVHYEVVIKEIGYGPEPFAVADAHMYADGHPIVFFEGMSLKLTNTDRRGMEALWQEERVAETPKALFTRQHILEFAVGNPSLSFGEPYQVFDRERVIARLPGPPFCFINRITKVEPPPWVLKPDGWIEAQWDVTAEDWYFIADRSGMMPYCVLLEIALQPCGWLAAYVGSALRSQKDLKFRNLGGSAVVHRNLYPTAQTLTMRARMTKVSEAGEMIIENFDFEVLCQGVPVYTGNTYFGFFAEAALKQQKGLPAKDHCPQADLSSRAALENNGVLQQAEPFSPQEAERFIPFKATGLELPSKALLMVDRITAFAPSGGPAGLGYICGEKRVDPDEWFFAAHFHQDPVCPGSLGVESFLQLLKFYAKKHWHALERTHTFEMMPQKTHQWSYRGQIVPTNTVVKIEAVVTAIGEEPEPFILADGWISVDGLSIYKMENFGLRLAPIK